MLLEESLRKCSRSFEGFFTRTFFRRRRFMKIRQSVKHFFSFSQAKQQDLSIRQSKSDSILQAYESFYSQHHYQQREDSFEALANNQQPHHRSVTFFCGGDCDSQGSVDSTMLTIEELRSYNKSCSTCGVSWYDEHVSLDCSECGGYAMKRPCPQCDGQCSNLWRRDLDASHSTHKAKWEGDCQMRKEGPVQSTNRQQSENDMLVKALDKLTTPL